MRNKMKPGTPIEKAKPSKCPQLWATEWFNSHTTVRIVYPSGLVEYAYGDFGFADEWRPFFIRGCTCRTTMKAALKAVKEWVGINPTFFLGYL